MEKQCQTGVVQCDGTCKVTKITACKGGDGCCPSGCDISSDIDCPPQCQGNNARCIDDRTLGTCFNGVELKQKCTGSCFPVSFRGTPGPICGDCIRETCKCDFSLGDPTFLVTSCGVDGEAYNFACEGRPCASGHCPDGERTFYTPFCPNY
jgi:hypothetical protein